MKPIAILTTMIIASAPLLRCAAPEPERASAPRKKPSTTTDDGTPNGDSASNSGGSDSKTSCRALQEQFSATTVARGAAPIPILGNINFALNINAAVDLQASDKSGKVGIDGQVLSAQPAAAKSIAEKAIGAYKDPLQLEFVSLKEQAGLAGYQGLDCVVAAVRSIRNNKMEYKYDPPIPFIALTGGTGSNAGGTRTFPNIKATIIRHFESAAKPGVYPGSVTMVTSGNSVKIQFNFGTTIPSMFATPVASIEYLLSGSQISAVNTKIFVAANSTTELTLNKK